MVFQITEQPLFVFAELEIIIFFLAKFDFAPFRAELAIGSALFISEKLFLPNAVVAGLFVFVDSLFVPESLQNFLHTFLVKWIGGRRPSVVLHVELFPKINKLLRDALDEFARRNACLRSRLLHLLAVLIDARQEKNFLAFEPMIPRDHIGENFLVSVTDVRRRVRVIDRRGNKKFFRHWRFNL